MTEVKCCLRVLEIRGGEVGPPGEGVCLALRVGVLSQRGRLSKSQADRGPWPWPDPSGSRVELLLLALCVSYGMVSGLAGGIPLGLSVFRSWSQAGMASEES